MITLAAATFALQAASFVGNLFGGMSAASRQRKIGKALAVDATARGEESVFALRQDVSRLMGRQTSGFGAGGVDLKQGSAKAIRDETVSFAERDVRQLRLNAAREARGLKMGANMQAAQFRSQALGSAMGQFPTLMTSGRDAWQSMGWGNGVKAAVSGSKGLAGSR